MDFAELIAVVTREATFVAGADGISLILKEGDLCHYVEERAIAPLWKGRKFPMISCVSGWAMMHREAVSIPDIYRDVRVPHDAYRPTFVRSLLLLPVPKKAPIAALGIYWATHHEHTPDEIEALQSVADSLAAPIKNLCASASE